MAFADYCNELKGYIPRLSPFLCQKFVNRAWSDVRNADDWSFLEGMTILNAPAVVTAGTISFNQFESTINGDGPATDKWATLLAGTPPFVATTSTLNFAPLIGTGYQIRMTNGPLYTIIGYDDSRGFAVLTVDRPISEPSRASIPYQAYRAYYGAPSLDFLSYTSVTNVAQGFTIRGRRLTGAQDQLNAIDPQRGATEDMYFMFSLFADADGMPIKEAWPHPVNQQGYIAMYKRRGTDLSDSVDIPASFPVNTLLERAKMYAAQWKATQRREPGDETDWVLAANTHKLNYNGPEGGSGGDLWAAKKKDSSLRTPAPIIRRGVYGSPFGSGFNQNHDVARMLGAFPFFGSQY